MEYEHNGVKYAPWDLTARPGLLQRISDGKIGWFLNDQFITIDPTGHPKKEV
jgi:hypothetical protein